MEIDVYFRFLGALLFVLALIGAAGWAARRFGLGGRLAPNPGKTRRLAVVEVAPLDSRRKLVLVRRDSTEHLLLLGSGQDILVEGGIGAPGADETPGDQPGRSPDRTQDAAEDAADDAPPGPDAPSFEDSLRQAT